MGRYAYFNTGLEYKFTFAKQDSEDIKKFYGKSDNRCLTVTWIKSDIPLISNKLKEYPYNVDFSKYENNLNGTYILYNDLFCLYKCENYTYRLGCLIYHQLQYTNKLYVEYEDDDEYNYDDDEYNYDNDNKNDDDNNKNDDDENPIENNDEK